MSKFKSNVTITSIAVMMSTAATLAACNSHAPPAEPEQQTQRTDTTTGMPNDMLSAGDMQGITLSESAADEAIAHVKSVRRKQPSTPISTSMGVLSSGNEWMPIAASSGEKYSHLNINQTVLTSQQPVSTFSIDVDTGAYSNVRRFLQNGQLPPADAVRVEEMLNYFSYDYDSVAGNKQPFSLFTEVGPTPWNAQTHLLHIALQGKMPANINDRSANLVFLIDVSGSMNSPEKLGLLKSAISLMIRQLDENDTVSMVVYAGASGVVLEATAGNRHRRIERALARLQAGGSTNGAQGIELAYQLASENYKKNGTNRVILATDGDFNVGLSTTPALVQMIEKKRIDGIALTTLGFGVGNYNDHLMEQLADAGNGNYAYIDNLGEARKVLVEELNSTLVTIAKDVKIQVEFNPATVSEYRLIGYANRLLDNENFNDDRVDAGEVGAGHSVIALYEVALQNEGGERHTPRRYGKVNNTPASLYSNELAELRLRYKQPDNDKSLLLSQLVNRPARKITISATTKNFQFAASIAGFAQLLRGDTRIEDFSYTDAYDLAKTTMEADPFGYRAEYLRLLDLAQSLENLQRASAGAGHDSKG